MLVVVHGERRSFQMQWQRGQLRRGGGNQGREEHEGDGELDPLVRNSLGQVNLPTPFDSIEAQIHLLQHTVDQ